MTRERLVDLMELVDEVNEKLNVCAGISHSRYSDELHVSLFYMDKEGEPLHSQWFTTDKIGGYTWVNDDKDLEHGEAFLRGLLMQAETDETMRLEVRDD